MHAINADQAEIDKFSSLSSTWWDPSGPLKTLHDINPLRLAWIRTQAGHLEGQQILDVGCGGGLLAESMAQEGAQVTGIDLAEQSLQIARLHGLESGIHVDYQHTSAESFANTHPAKFDIVSCMELLEHVPDPASVVRACATLTKPGGWVFFSTLNRNPKSFLMAIVGAEYLLRMLPRGTHNYENFIKPSELGAAARAAGLSPISLAGLAYNPFTRLYRVTDEASVNYMLATQREA
ncbi:bifunctional 2-polyprenyl-6-hydroxyphenol methylase/3-demethylubiquinol 3-O-methyltransferase UbiG [Alcaligenaceae bacterium CGII-47]|nr:bifunctional 2-polyprenyl-6-hydroxyphenol methylase/3-demethylubiquinol 3-O-methyltransferase UbiG [Alcaligenaceae bacterium CGII-47]